MAKKKYLTADEAKEIAIFQDKKVREIVDYIDDRIFYASLNGEQKLIINGEYPIDSIVYWFFKKRGYELYYYKTKKELLIKW